MRSPFLGSKEYSHTRIILVEFLVRFGIKLSSVRVKGEMVVGIYRHEDGRLASRRGSKSFQRFFLFLFQSSTVEKPTLKNGNNRI